MLPSVHRNSKRYSFCLIRPTNAKMEATSGLKNALQQTYLVSGLLVTLSLSLKNVYSNKKLFLSKLLSANKYTITWAKGTLGTVKWTHANTIKTINELAHKLGLMVWLWVWAFRLKRLKSCWWLITLLLYTERMDKAEEVGQLYSWKNIAS